VHFTHRSTSSSPRSRSRITITIAEGMTIHRPVMLLVQLQLDYLNVVWRGHQALACSSFPSMRLRPPFHRYLQ
jgi:hypothetical protein